MTNYLLIRASAFIICAFLSSLTVMAQSFSPYSDFLNMTPTQLSTLQVKLTWGGAQTDLMASVVILGPTATLNLSQFVAFRRATFNYSNDSSQPGTVNLSTSALQTMLQSLNSIPAVQAGSVETPAFLSFAMVNTVSAQTKGFEAILNPTDGATLLSSIRTALQGTPGLRSLDDFACGTGLTGSAVPTDVTSKIVVTLGGVRLNRTNGYYVSTATLKNNSSSAIALPISLVMALPSDIQLIDGSTTCAVGPAGRAYVNAPLTAPLAAGASVTMNVQFSNPNQIPITGNTQVLSGPGSR